MKRIIVTGAAGFLGYSTVHAFVEHGFFVYAVVRAESSHNERLNAFKNVKQVPLEMSEYDRLTDVIDERCDALVHLAWAGGRYDMDEQFLNVDATIALVKAAHELGCSRIVITGSQAEYGATTEIQKEVMMPMPFCAYGSAKVAVCYLSKNIVHSFGMEWVWGRVFSLYGLYEPSGRLFPDLIRKLKANEEITLSSCRQNWDYLDVADAADAVVALMERGRDGEIYNIANGDHKSLREFLEEAKRLIGSDSRIIYGDDPDPFVSLQPSVEKIKNDTGWTPRISFEEGVISAANLM